MVLGKKKIVLCVKLLDNSLYDNEERQNINNYIKFCKDLMIHKIYNKLIFPFI